MTSAARTRVAAWPFDVRPGDVPRNLEGARRGLERAAEAGARLLVLPEKWTTSYLPEYPADMRRASDDALLELHRSALERDVTVVGSALGGAGALPWNELHVLGAAGGRGDVRPYRKRMLFSPMDEAASCAAGDGVPQVVTTPVGRAAGIVCYDLRFPEVTRHAFYGDADLLLVPAEWPSSRAATFELLSCARAAENQCWVVACNRAGSIDHDGQALAFPGTALLVDPYGRIATRSDDGALLVGELDAELVAEARRRIPCARDLARAGLRFSG
jgi:predicted amidohydrolase